jgi:hypothetical protein
MGCYECVKACADKEECVYAGSKVCKSAARVLNIVKAETLGIDDEAREGRGKHFGLKLEKAVDLIKPVYFSFLSLLYADLNLVTQG